MTNVRIHIPVDDDRPIWQTFVKICVQIRDGHHHDDVADQVEDGARERKRAKYPNHVAVAGSCAHPPDNGYHKTDQARQNGLRNRVTIPQNSKVQDCQCDYHTSCKK